MAEQKINKILVLDLFAGCGGLSDGFLQTRAFEEIAAVEWKKPQVETLRHREKLNGVNQMSMNPFFYLIFKKKMNYSMEMMK